MKSIKLIDIINNDRSNYLTLYGVVIEQQLINAFNGEYLLQVLTPYYTQSSNKHAVGEEIEWRIIHFFTRNLQYSMVNECFQFQAIPHNKENFSQYLEIINSHIYEIPKDEKTKILSRHSRPTRVVTESRGTQTHFKFE